jgi:hypothetical protein
MPQANAAHTTTSARVASNSPTNEIADEFIVEAADGPDGAFRPLLDRAGEPALHPTLSCASDVAEGWAASFNVETRVRSHLSGAVIDTEPSDDELDAMWLAAKRAEWDEADRRDYERRRARANRPILEKALEDEALYGEVAA